jgi:hypothetical protein
VSETGDYAVYLRWPADPNRPDAAPIEVHYDDESQLDDSLTVNQKVNGDQWNYVGTYRFVAGSDDRVMILADDVGATIADAARFEKVP